MGRSWVQWGCIGAVLAGLVGCGGTTTTTVSTEVKGQAVVQVTSPASGTVINANVVTVRGTVSPPTASVQVDGSPAAVGNGVFTGSAHLQVGKTTIDVIASAPGLTPGSTSIVITRPGGKPNPPVAPPGGTTTTTTTVPQPSSSQSSCGGGLSVGPNTSCAFAANVRASYNGTGVYSVYSPVTNQFYTISCYSHNPVVCTGGNNASVYFPG